MAEPGNCGVPVESRIKCPRPTFMFQIVSSGRHSQKLSGTGKPCGVAVDRITMQVVAGSWVPQFHRIVSENAAVANCNQHGVLDYQCQCHAHPQAMTPPCLAPGADTHPPSGVYSVHYSWVEIGCARQSVAGGPQLRATHVVEPSRPVAAPARHSPGWQTPCR